MRHTIKVTKITSSDVSDIYKNSIDFIPRYVFGVKLQTNPLIEMTVVLGMMYRDDAFSSYIFHGRFPTRNVTTIVVPHFKQVVYEVGDDGFIHSFDGIDGLYEFLTKTPLKYSEARKSFLEKVLNRAFWPYNADILSVLSTKLKRG